MKQPDNKPSLSILIPRYNFDIRELVTDLLTQGEELVAEFEVRVVDDASPVPIVWSEPIESHPCFFYECLPVNIGRSRIRNYLAEQARYDYLLFLDCDSRIPSHFLQLYLQEALSGGVVTGGTRYTEHAPDDPLLHLHWHYGAKVEVKALQKSDVFHSNNFLIDRTLFMKVRFDEQITGYGHEDTFFRIALQRLGVPIRKINNPVYHIGLNTAADFLRNTRNAIDNLLEHPEYMPKHPVVRIHRIMSRLHLNSIFVFLFNRLSGNMERRLNRANPSLRLFNGYKLLYIMSR